MVVLLQKPLRCTYSTAFLTRKKTACSAPTSEPLFIGGLPSMALWDRVAVQDHGPDQSPSAHYDSWFAEAKPAYHQCLVRPGILERALEPANIRDEQQNEEERQDGEEQEREGRVAIHFFSPTAP